jgi:hypothetical protein
MAEQTQSSTPDTGRSFSGGSMVFSLLLTTVFDIGLAIVIFQVARQRGVSEFFAYSLSSIGPLTGMGISLLRRAGCDFPGRRSQPRPIALARIP